jgi:hypothetical protein
MGIFFEKFVRDKGYDGVITIEGGDDPEFTAKAGISVVLFNKDKVLSHRSVDITPTGVENKQVIPELSIDKTSPTLDDSARETLNRQWAEFWKLRSSEIKNTGEAQKVETIKNGDLLHNLRYDEASLTKILKSGILSGELGYSEKETRPEDAETHYCADFFVNQGDKSISQYIEYASGDEENTGRLRKKRIESFSAPKEQSDGVAVVVDSSRPELATLLQHSGTGIDAQPLSNFPVRFPYDENKPEIAQRHLAVLVGIPANFIKSIVVGGKIANDMEKLSRLKEVVAGSGLDIPLFNYKGERI